MREKTNVPSRIASASIRRKMCSMQAFACVDPGSNATVVRTAPEGKQSWRLHHGSPRYSGGGGLRAEGKCGKVRS